MNMEKIADLALQQIDSAGYYLSRYGITDKLNRHNLIAYTITEKEHLSAELSRWEFKARIQKQRIEKLGHELNDRADHWIGQTPEPIRTQLLKAKSRVA